MRNVVVSEYVTLDGVMEDPGGVDTFKESNWHFPFLNEEAQKYKHDELFACDALLLGRRTYQEFAPVWPQVSGLVLPQKSCYVHVCLFEVSRRYQSFAAQAR